MTKVEQGLKSANERLVSSQKTLRDKVKELEAEVKYLRSCLNFPISNLLWEGATIYASIHSRTSDETYRVWANTKTRRWACGCPAGRYGTCYDMDAKPPCWHLESLRDHLNRNGLEKK